MPHDVGTGRGRGRTVEVYRPVVEQAADSHRQRDAQAPPVRGDPGLLPDRVAGLFKTEVIWPNGPWKSLEEVEFAVLEWVDWFNNRRLLSSIGDIPPAEFEEMYYADQASSTKEAGLN